MIYYVKKSLSKIFCVYRYFKNCIRDYKKTNIISKSK